MSNIQPDSLVKYGTAILVATSLTGKKPVKKPTKVLAPIQQSAAPTRNEDYLNSILPPREYTENGQLWVRYVSPTPATKADVMNLQDELDKRLQARGARETGICPVREELFNQCFDEIIRQITINCAERGFLLVRCRDEIKMTIAAYQTLYESSIAYGMRKALMSEQRKNQMQSEIKQLEETCNRLTSETKQYEDEIKEMEKRDEEDRLTEQKAHEDKVNYLNDLNTEYKQELQNMLSAPAPSK